MSIRAATGTCIADYADASGYSALSMPPLQTRMQTQSAASMFGSGAKTAGPPPESIMALRYRSVTHRESRQVIMPPSETVSASWQTCIFTPQLLKVLGSVLHAAPAPPV